METQFVSSRNSENANHKFKEFLKENRVKHIVANKSSSNKWKNREVVWITRAENAFLQFHRRICKMV